LIYRGFTLNSFQAAAAAGIDAGRSVLLSAPTGAGKTLVAEYAVEKVLKGGNRAIYTAPIKALSNQKYRDFKVILDKDVGIMTGDITLDPDAPLLIMTTEIFRNTIFERPKSLDDVACVVFDEVHYMDDPERGTVWEESIIFAPPHIRFICLSATISNIKQFGSWISKTREEEIEVIRSCDRPVPLKHYLYFPGYGPTRADRITGFPSNRKKRGGKQKEMGNSDDLIQFLKRNRKLPVLCFCFSRKECERRARDNRRMRLLSGEERDRMEKIFDKISSDYTLTPDAALDGLRALAMEGVGFHHAGLLPQHKELVERLFTSGLIKLLFTTETFALGINMPARTVIFTSVRKFDGVGFDTMTTREYQQMSGRAGRQGIDKEGLIYSIIEGRRTAIKDIKKLLSNDVEPVQSRFNLSYSSLINLHRNLGDRIYSAWESSFNNFQWSRMSRKKREKNRNKQVSVIRKKMGILNELGYIEDTGLSPKGKVAALINGYELQAAELLFSGLLEWFNEVQINVVLGAILFEERRGDLFSRMNKKLLGEHRFDVDRCIENVIAAERKHGVRRTVSKPNFKIAEVISDWCAGAEMRDLEKHTNASPGDLVRTFRLTIQLIRQIRKAMPRNPALSEKLGRCIELINREEVDALRQLKTP